jgi:hypothetical protein
MISWTLKLTKKFKDSNIEVRTLVDNNQTREYNLVYIDDKWVVNYDDNGPVPVDKVNGSFKIENLVEVTAPR